MKRKLEEDDRANKRQRTEEKDQPTWRAIEQVQTAIVDLLSDIVFQRKHGSLARLIGEFCVPKLADVVSATTSLMEEESTVIDPSWVGYPYKFALPMSVCTIHAGHVIGSMGNKPEWVKCGYSYRFSTRLKDDALMARVAWISFSFDPTTEPTPMNQTRQSVLQMWDDARHCRLESLQFSIERPKTGERIAWMITDDKTDCQLQFYC